jgi:L-glyceraldehyde 3-phosphate reductase
MIQYHFFYVSLHTMKKTAKLREFSVDENRYDGRMVYERCGRSGVLLPRVSLGFWHNFGRIDDYSVCRKIARFAFDHGITHFDLANNYGPPYGSAEETLGKMMDDDFRPFRDELFISTKAGYDMWPGPYGNWGSRKYLVASLDQSLERMGLDYVDLFYSHRYDPNTPLEETLQALVDIVHAGKALYVGISRWPLEPTRFAINYLREQHVPLLIYQGRLNMIDRAPVEEGIMDLVNKEGVGFISFSPLAQGLLTDRYLHGIPADSRMAQGRFLKKDMLTEELLAKLKKWNAVAADRGETLAEMALAWILHHKAVTSVLVGASSTEQLEKNLKCITAEPFSDEEL